MNILYLHTHDTGRVISPYGFAVDTPNYEAFCKESLLFQNAFSVAPTCSPSRAGLLTGIYPHQNGMLGLAQRGFELDKDKHLANFLNRNGYHTVLCGVQHEIGYYLDHEKALGTLGYDEDLSENHESYEEADLVYWDNKNADNLCQWLKTASLNKPFFISYGMHATHREFPQKIDPSINLSMSQPPIDIPNIPTTREDYARYKTSIKMADANLGKVIDVLKEVDLYEKTIIILTTDHGLAYPFHKCTLTDNGTGVLFAMRVPGSKQKNDSCDDLISHIDVFPTLCDLLKIAPPDYLEGQSFAGLFTGQPFKKNEAIFSEINFHTSYEPVRAVRTKRFKYVRYFDETYLGINYSNIDNSDVKEFYRENGLELQTKDLEALYDLYYDPAEKNNVIGKKVYKETTEMLRQKLQNFMERTDDPLINGPIPIKDGWRVNKSISYSPSSKNVKDYISLGKGKE